MKWAEAFTKIQAKVQLMVNGLHLYSAFIQSSVQLLILIPTHTPTAIGCYARHQPARQEQSGVRRLAQGHFDTPRVGSNRQPSDCQTTALTPWAISPWWHIVDDQKNYEIHTKLD